MKMKKILLLIILTSFYRSIEIAIAEQTEVEKLNEKIN
jgi:hypothetical protein